MTRRLALLLALAFAGDEPPRSGPEPPRKVLVLTSGRSWTLRVWGVYAGRATLERDRKLILLRWRGRPEEVPEFNPPVEATLDEMLKERP